MDNVLVLGLLASVYVSLFSVLGGCLIFLKKSYSKENINFLLNISAGVMLASSFLTLLVPGMENIIHSENNCIFINGLYIVLSLVLGIVFVWALHFVLPHEHETTGKHGLNMDLRRSWLFIIAIAIHKLPEGLAVGVAYAGEQIFNPDVLAISIAVHNIPEGLMVAVTLIAINFTRLKAALFASLTALLQPVGALIGIYATELSVAIVPYAMIWASGAMLFVVINEILPETFANNRSDKNSLGLFLGLLFMTYMSIVLH